MGTDRLEFTWDLVDTVWIYLVLSGSTCKSDPMWYLTFAVLELATCKKREFVPQQILLKWVQSGSILYKHNLKLRKT